MLFAKQYKVSNKTKTGISWLLAGMSYSIWYEKSEKEESFNKFKSNLTKFYTMFRTKCALSFFPSSAQMSVPDLDMEEDTDIYARAARH